jgi:hypothetical protein
MVRFLAEVVLAARIAGNCWVPGNWPGGHAPCEGRAGHLGAWRLAFGWQLVSVDTVRTLYMSLWYVDTSDNFISLELMRRLIGEAVAPMSGLPLLATLIAGYAVGPRQAMEAFARNRIVSAAAGLAILSALATPVAWLLIWWAACLK